MNNIKDNKKKMLRSCFALCLAGGLAWSASFVPAQAAPGTAINSGTRVRDSIGGTPIGSLAENQSVEILGEQSSGDGYTWYQITFDWNGQEAEGWVRSDMINAEGVDSSSETSGNSGAADTADGTGVDVEQDAQDGVFLINGSNYVIADSFPSSEIPEGFTETTITYGGSEVPAAQMDSNTSVTLLYLENEADSTVQGVYLLDAERNAAIPFITAALPAEDSYVVLTDIPLAEQQTIASAYVETECVFGEGPVMAYQLQSAENGFSPDMDVTEFFWLYGTASDGVSGWYLFDAEEQTLQRSITDLSYDAAALAAADTAETDEDAAPVFELDAMTRMLIGGMGVILLLLLILLIAKSVRYRRLRKYVESEDYEEDACDAENFAEEAGADGDGWADSDDDLSEKLTFPTIEVKLTSGKVDIMDLDDEIAHAAEAKSQKIQAQSAKMPEMNEQNLQRKNGQADAQSADAKTPKTESKPAKKESSPEAAKMAEDLKKMIQEVETIRGTGEVEAFYDDEEEEESGFEEETDKSQKEGTSKKKNSREEDSDWDDIEFL